MIKGNPKEISRKDGTQKSTISGDIAQKHPVAKIEGYTRCYIVNSYISDIVIKSNIDTDRAVSGNHFRIEQKLRELKIN